MDIRLYRRSHRYADTSKLSEEMDGSPLSEPPASGIEVIANRVVKFMLTTLGSDLLDPDYGSYLPTYTQISQGYLPKLRLELSEDLERCSAYIRSADTVAKEAGERLQSLSLQKVVYNQVTRNRLDIYIEIRTTEGRYALLELPVNS